MTEEEIRLDERKILAEKLLIQLKALTFEVSIGNFYGDDFLRLSDIEDEIEQLIK